MIPTKPNLKKLKPRARTKTKIRTKPIPLTTLKEPLIPKIQIPKNKMNSAALNKSAFFLSSSVLPLVSSRRESTRFILLLKISSSSNQLPPIINRQFTSSGLTFAISLILFSLSSYFWLFTLRLPAWAFLITTSRKCCRSSSLPLFWLTLATSFVRFSSMSVILLVTPSNLSLKVSPLLLFRANIPKPSSMNLSISMIFSLPSLEALHLLFSVASVSPLRLPLPVVYLVSSSHSFQSFLPVLSPSSSVSLLFHSAKP